MADTATLRNTGDAYVSNATANVDKNFSNTQKLYVKENNPDKRWGYLYFGQPFPPGAKVINAYLEVYNGTAINGGTLTVQRISEPWKRNKITWNNKPATAGASFTVTKSGTVPVGTPWRVNITAMMQAVADGERWFGVRFTMNDGAGDWFYGSLAKTAGLRPIIVVEYVDSPDVPTNLSPRNGNAVDTAKPLLTFDWTDDRGATALSAVRVLVSANADMSSPWDSGWVATTAPELNLANTSYPGLAAGSTAYWQVQVRDGSGVESLRSETASFKRVALVYPVITNPAGAEPNAYVEENSPPITWTFAGNQVHWQVIIYDQADGNKILADSKKVTGTQKGWTPPDLALVVGNTYTVAVRVWDDVVRERNGDTPAYSETRKQFKIVYTATVTPVANLNVTQVTPYHWAKVEWTRGTAADFYEIYANGVLVKKVPAADVTLTGGVYSYIIRTAPPRRDVVWSVTAIVNGKGSTPNPTITKNFKARSAVLSETDGTDPIMFLNYDRDQGRARQQTIHDVVGNYPPVLIKQALGGRSGSFVGVLSGNSVPGVTVDVERQRWDRLDKNEGRTVLITILDESFECYIANGEIQSFADAEGVFYEVSFEYYEVNFS